MVQGGWTEKGCRTNRNAQDSANRQVSKVKRPNDSQLTKAKLKPCGQSPAAHNACRPCCSSGAREKDAGISRDLVAGAGGLVGEGGEAVTLFPDPLGISDRTLAR